MSVHEGAPAPGSTRAMSPVIEAPMSLPSDETMPTADLFASLAALVDRQHEMLEALQHREEDPPTTRRSGQPRSPRRPTTRQQPRRTRPGRAAHHPQHSRPDRSQRTRLRSGLRGKRVPSSHSGAFPTRRVQAHIASDVVHLLAISSRTPWPSPRDPARLGSVVKGPSPQGSMHQHGRGRRQRGSSQRRRSGKSQRHARRAS